MKYPKVRPYFHQIQLMYITKNVDLEIEKDGLGRQGMVSKLYTLYHTNVDTPLKSDKNVDI